MCICNVALAWNQWSVFRNLDENHAFFHSFVRGHWAYGKHAILELECAFYLTFGTFLDVCIRFFFTFAVSSCVKPAGTIVQDQEIKKKQLRSINHVYKCTDTRQLRSINHVYKCTDTRQLRSINHVYKCTNTSTGRRQRMHVLRQYRYRCSSSRMSLHPTPPTHPNPTCYVASNTCATSTMSLHPTPPTHPNPTCYVASNMCATSTMSLHPTPPTHPTQPTWQAWRKMHWFHRLQWAKHVPKRVVTSDWSQQTTNKLPFVYQQAPGTYIHQLVLQTQSL